MNPEIYINLDTQKDGNVQPILSEICGPPSPLTFYQIKWLKWNNKDFPVITQNENGPCPLLALINALLLMEKFSLPNVIEIITPEQLIEYIADFILANNHKNIPEEHLLNYEQNVQDALALLPKLQTGIDVNIRFTGPKDFEYTPECIIFDLLNIPLYHGWIIDPINENDIAKCFLNLTYNQAIDKIISDKNTDDDTLQNNALLMENFLLSSSHQLTYFGLRELNTFVKENEMIVLFRNNHFTTLTKHKDNLYILVTDQGYINEKNVMWETLSSIEGNETFVNGLFQPSQNNSQLQSMSSNEDQLDNKQENYQLNSDYLIALSLQKEQELLEKKPIAQSFKLKIDADELKYKYQNLGPVPDELLTDMDIAQKLQAQEDYVYAQELSQQDKDKCYENAGLCKNKDNKIRIEKEPFGQSTSLFNEHTVLQEEDKNINKELRKKCIIS